MEERYIEMLWELNRAMGEVSYETKAHRSEIDEFIAPDHGLSRVLSAAPGGRGSRTGSSFAVLAFAKAGLLRSVIDRPEWKQVPSYFAAQIANDLVPLPPVISPRPNPHLNEYSIPI